MKNKLVVSSNLMKKIVKFLPFQVISLCYPYAREDISYNCRVTTISQILCISQSSKTS